MHSPFERTPLPLERALFRGLAGGPAGSRGESAAVHADAPTDIASDEQQRHRAGRDDRKDRAAGLGSRVVAAGIAPAADGIAAPVGIAATIIAVAPAVPVLRETAAVRTGAAPVVAPPVLVVPGISELEMPAVPLTEGEPVIALRRFAGMVGVFPTEGIVASGIAPVGFEEIVEVVDAVTFEIPDIESQVELGLRDLERLRVAVMGIVGAGICSDEEKS